MAEQDDRHEDSLAGLPVFVNEEPMVFWSRAHARDQAKFLQGVDPEYFSYHVGMHRTQLDGDNRARASLAIRFAHSHALEILFAFICAAVQAPKTPAGWLLKYKNSDLVCLVRKIHQGQPFTWKLKDVRMNWKDIASVLLQAVPDVEREELIEATSTLWRALAADFLDTHRTDEYNSLKHGLRVHSSEFVLNIGAKGIRGVPAPPERMRNLVNSPYGSTFLRAQKLKTHQWRIEEQRVNWDPSQLATQSDLMAKSIHNVISFLRLVNAVPTEEVFFYYIDQDQVSDALRRVDRSSSFKFSMRDQITSDMIPDVSRDDVRSKYLQLPLRPDDQLDEIAPD